MRRAWFVLLATAGLLALGGCGSGSAPSLSSLTITTLPVTRGTTEVATVIVSDPEGLGGLKMEMTFSGPITATVPVQLSGTSPSMTTAKVTLQFRLKATAPSGTYTISVTATDGDGHRSAPVSTTFTL